MIISYTTLQTPSHP